LGKTAWEILAGSRNDLKLNLSRFVPPAPDSMSFAETWQDDSSSLNNHEASVSVNKEFSEPRQIKVLKTVTVKGWKSPRKELDLRYT
jgi:hypothetical protein